MSGMYPESLYIVRVQCRPQLVLRMHTAMTQSRHMLYVSGRQRKAGETNGKSGNLNNLVRLLYPEGTPVPLNEVIAVFDADQVRWLTTR